MPRKPTGRPRGRPAGTGQLDHPKRINVWLSGETYARLEAYADGRSYIRVGAHNSRHAPASLSSICWPVPRNIRHSPRLLLIPLPIQMLHRPHRAGARARPRP